jgi:hypothetical protein
MRTGTVLAINLHFTVRNDIRLMSTRNKAMVARVRQQTNNVA